MRDSPAGLVGRYFRGAGWAKASSVTGFSPSSAKAGSGACTARGWRRRRLPQGSRHQGPLDPDPPRSLLTRFRDEARILGLLRDRAIVGVEPPIQISGRWAVVMEFVDGTSAGSLLDRGPIPPGVALEVVMEIARALHNAYHMPGPEGEPLQLLHRDVKPDNIQITPSGDVRLLDFGIAKANFAAREFHTRQSFGGTPGYIAPERPRGIELPVGDVFSLGVVLHEIVVGKRPRYTPTVNLDLDVESLATELDVEPRLLKDDDTAAVLRLAASMRTEEPEDRPSARQVEDSCRALRLKLPPPYLREWAEENVPHRVELDPDEMVGKVLTTTVSTTVPMSLPDEPTRTMPHATVPALTPVPEERSNARLAVGAVLGGSAALLALIAVTAVALAVLGVYLVATGGRTATVVPDPEPTDAVTAPTGDDDDDDDVVEAPPEPDGPDVAPAPQPQPTRPQPAEVPVIEVPVSQPHPTPTPTPTVEPEPAGPKRPTGKVVVRTIPTGASLYENGEKLVPDASGEYELRIGTHRLKLVGPGGEQYELPVHVPRDQTVPICYDFDHNRSCASP
ncbi:MAG: serine/threonine-protein kinase [Myxococcota bacterium]